MQSASDDAARHAAKRVGLIAKKSRRGLSLDNFGGHMLIDPAIPGVVAGSRYDLTADEVVDYCTT